MPPGALGQFVGGQGGLHVEIEQQHAQARVRGEPAQVGGRRVLPTPPFVEMMDTTCMALSGWEMGSPRENGSGPVVEALGDPLVDFDRIPADGAHAQAQRLGKLALLHQVVNVGAFEAGLGFETSSSRRMRRSFGGSTGAATWRSP